LAAIGYVRNHATHDISPYRIGIISESAGGIATGAVRWNDSPAKGPMQ